MSDDATQRLEGWALIAAERHKPEGGGCTCGFCARSAEHVVIMALREGTEMARRYEAELERRVEPGRP